MILNHYNNHNANYNNSDKCNSCFTSHSIKITLKKQREGEQIKKGKKIFLLTPHLATTEA